MYACIGSAVASSVTTLHTPKLFCFQKSSDSADVKAYEKLISGVVGLKLKGNIAMRTIMVGVHYLNHKKSVCDSINIELLL
jgi:hypothetical protein